MTTEPVPACTDDLLGEIEAECATKWSDRPAEDRVIEVPRSIMALLFARLRAAEVDAGRYRWLRDKYHGLDQYRTTPGHKDRIARLIDAEISREAKQ